MISNLPVWCIWSISRLLEEHKMEIVDAASEKLAKSIRNSKAFKERKQEVMEDTE